MISGSVVVTGGGTGGHLAVAKALTEEFYTHGYKTIFIGSVSGQDRDWFEHDTHIKEAIFLKTAPVVNQGLFGKIKSLFNILKGTNHCLRIFKKHNVTKVISVGGYSAAAASFAAILSRRCNLYIHEQNSVKGVLNKLLSPFAKEVFCSFDKNSVVKDYPVNAKFFENARIRDNEVKTILFIGGSQGAKAINNYALKVAPRLQRSGIKIIHQTGKNDEQRVKKEYEKLGIEADVFGFTKEIEKKMNKADFAVSRAGASTLWELTANALPTLFVPYPYAASDHQYYNAKFLEDKKLAFLRRQNSLSHDDLFKFMNSDLHKMSKGLVDAIMIDGIVLIVEAITKPGLFQGTAE